MPRFRCEDCGRMVTRGPSGLEYGHLRGTHRAGETRCPRRPEEVDPDKPGRDAGTVPHEAVAAARERARLSPIGTATLVGAVSLLYLLVLAIVYGVIFG